MVNKFRILLLILLGQIFCCVAMAQTPKSNSSSLVVDSNLSAAGRWMVDANGRVVILRGVNMINKNSPYTLSSAGFREEDAKLIQAAGMNVVRVGLIWEAIEPYPGKYDDAYLADMAKTIAMLHAQGINTLLDMHQDQYGKACNGVGAPVWATVIDGKQFPNGCNPNKLPFPKGELTDPSVSNVWDSFWSNKSSTSTGLIGLQDRYTSMWAYVTKRLQGVPGIIGYEIMNEPYPGTLCKAGELGEECTSFDKNSYAKFIQKVSSGIRSVDSKKLIYFEPSVFFDFGTATQITPPSQSNIGFSFHPYLTMKHVLINALDYSAKNPSLAMFATEWGAFTGTKPLSEEAVAIEIVAGSSNLDKAKMSAIYWAYSNPAPTTFLPDAYKQGLIWDLKKPRMMPNLMVDRVNALTWPYPQAIAGTPIDWSFDPVRKLFKLTYQATNPVGVSLDNELQTEIALPVERFSRGYEVFVEGARVSSPPNSPKLIMLNLRDAKTVSVEVQGL
ncbi:cellulase family glycosylhydrolase [Polynucleobacter sp. AP-Jannik-300A-C4]|uniref:cellulase family glycosylhydrolase n=1 Tax=Polynucleobacter sp. AP-Jannik-300A-C4 TaxID=2576928 RepID=UPI001BFE0A78|nr:cellulase family glycosylhydrolase [Polynucleobacter sp. AP-Jannik-300A-C4]QWE22270.1 cellulase family glycosylhydrolase [Polynucleobacter sp. AP-Jannik-300A-C4]